jgi:hypothetical protein
MNKIYFELYCNTTKNIGLIVRFLLIFSHTTVTRNII